MEVRALLATLKRLKTVIAGPPLFFRAEVPGSSAVARCDVPERRPVSPYLRLCSAKFARFCVRAVDDSAEDGERCGDAVDQPPQEFHRLAAAFFERLQITKYEQLDLAYVISSHYVRACGMGVAKVRNSVSWTSSREWHCRYPRPIPATSMRTPFSELCARQASRMSLTAPGVLCLLVCIGVPSTEVDTRGFGGAHALP